MRGYTALILPELREFLARSEEGLVRTAIEDLHPADLADICEHLEPDDAAKLLTLLPLAVATDVLEHLDPEEQTAMFERVGRGRLVRMLDDMNPDDRVDLVKRLPERSVELFVPLLAQAERNDVKRLMSYPEETAGALMTTEYVWLKKQLTVEAALAELRKVAPDSETIYYVYVVDDERRLLGVVSLRDIICARPGKQLGEVMTEHPVSVRIDEDQEAVARIFEKYDLQSVPVIDPGTGRIVGIITFDDVIDVIHDEATEDVQMLGGLEPLDDSYMASTLGHLVRKRVGWLVLLLVAHYLTAFALGFFEQRTDAAVFLMVIPFIPLVMAAGGNAGSQSATLVTRALATRDVLLKDSLRVVLREASTGLILGLLLAAAGLVPVLVMEGDGTVLAVVGCAICGMVFFGAVVGTIIPLGFHLVGIDPAVASAPLIASVSDLVAVTAYFTFASLLLGG